MEIIKEKLNAETFDEGDTQVAPAGEFNADEKVKIKKIRCSQCFSAQIYVLKDTTKCCRKCGFREKGDNDKIRSQATGNQQS